MKKHIIIGIMAILLIMPLAGANTNYTTKNNQQPTTANYDFTHTVIGEYVTTTTCGYCPTASNQLYSIYDSGDFEFYYVSLVADMNSKIYSRVQELGVTGVPDVYFDGGYRNLIGAQSDEQPYRNAITQCGERTVPDIEVDVSVEWKGGGTLKIVVTIQNNEAEEYDGHLRVYIVEPESRWNDAQGHPYHFGALALPIDKSLAVPQTHPYILGDTYTFSKTWFGALHGFGDITEDNIMVIAAVFDGETDYAVQTSAAEPIASTEQYSFFENFRIFRIFKESRLFHHLLCLI
jgi:hypothetical protein